MIMFKNISPGGLLAAVSLLIIAVVVFLLGVYEEHTNDDGGSMYLGPCWPGTRQPAGRCGR